ncbi:helix-turn-helix transcriptional regulator [Occallatibacter riparius]|uniref:Helix-turn-helix transcriptional regulator n=1 Tax=Occallatibacter riparius TaxID=1002689 RepID=A0A9J7BLZ9_9BACT|nr:helix-turn-helix transcriptional regulator [Occallatibacter riparius]UWZ81926.1 helix-turn-helix transcriptional regulator [Occallatibacter riparius]
MQIVHTTPGFILINRAICPVAFNTAALQILAFPTDPNKIHQPMLFIRDKITFWLLKSNGRAEPIFVHEIVSGQRKYTCRAFRCDWQIGTNEPMNYVVLLERHSHGPGGLIGLTEQFGLTPRELQTVSLLTEGLTSKQIASRMRISPNTVKAFLRLVMFKMDVSTRSGIVGKVFGSQPDTAEETHDRPNSSEQFT